MTIDTETKNSISGIKNEKHNIQNESANTNELDYQTQSAYEFEAKKDYIPGADVEKDNVNQLFEKDAETSKLEINIKEEVKIKEAEEVSNSIILNSDANEPPMLPTLVYTSHPISMNVEDSNIKMVDLRYKILDRRKYVIAPDGFIPNSEIRKVLNKPFKDDYVSKPSKKDLCAEEESSKKLLEDILLKYMPEDLIVDTLEPNLQNLREIARLNEAKKRNIKVAMNLDEVEDLNRELVDQIGGEDELDGMIQNLTLKTSKSKRKKYARQITKAAVLDQLERKVKEKENQRKEKIKKEAEEKEKKNQEEMDLSQKKKEDNVDIDILDRIEDKIRDPSIIQQKKDDEKRKIQDYFNNLDIDSLINLLFKAYGETVSFQLLYKAIQGDEVSIGKIDGVLKTRQNRLLVLNAITTPQYAFSYISTNLDGDAEVIRTALMIDHPNFGDKDNLELLQTKITDILGNERKMAQFLGNLNLSLTCAIEKLKQFTNSDSTYLLLDVFNKYPESIQKLGNILGDLNKVDEFINLIKKCKDTEIDKFEISVVVEVSKRSKKTKRKLTSDSERDDTQTLTDEQHSLLTPLPELIDPYQTKDMAKRFAKSLSQAIVKKPKEKRSKKGEVSPDIGDENVTRRPRISIHEELAYDANKLVKSDKKQKSYQTELAKAEIEVDSLKGSSKQDNGEILSQNVRVKHISSGESEMTQLTTTAKLKQSDILQSYYERLIKNAWWPQDLHCEIDADDIMMTLIKILPVIFKASYHSDLTKCISEFKRLFTLKRVTKSEIIEIVYNYFAQDSDKVRQAKDEKNEAAHAFYSKRVLNELNILKFFDEDIGDLEYEFLVKLGQVDSKRKSLKKIDIGDQFSIIQNILKVKVDDFVPKTEEFSKPLIETIVGSQSVEDVTLATSGLQEIISSSKSLKAFKSIASELSKKFKSVKDQLISAIETEKSPEEIKELYNKLITSSKTLNKISSDLKENHSKEIPSIQEIKENLYTFKQKKLPEEKIDDFVSIYKSNKLDVIEEKETKLFDETVKGKIVGTPLLKRELQIAKVGKLDKLSHIKELKQKPTTKSTKTEELAHKPVESVEKPVENISLTAVEVSRKVAESKDIKIVIEDMSKDLVPQKSPKSATVENIKITETDTKPDIKDLKSVPVPKITLKPNLVSLALHTAEINRAIVKDSSESFEMDSKYAVDAEKSKQTKTETSILSSDKIHVDRKEVSGLTTMEDTQRIKEVKSAKKLNKEEITMWSETIVSDLIDNIPLFKIDKNEMKRTDMEYKENIIRTLSPSAQSMFKGLVEIIDVLETTNADQLDSANSQMITNILSNQHIALQIDQSQLGELSKRFSQVTSQKSSIIVHAQNFIENTLIENIEKLILEISQDTEITDTKRSEVYNKVNDISGLLKVLSRSDESIDKKIKEIIINTAKIIDNVKQSEILSEITEQPHLQTHLLLDETNQKIIKRPSKDDIERLYAQKQNIMKHLQEFNVKLKKNIENVETVIEELLEQRDRATKDPEKIIKISQALFAIVQSSEEADRMEFMELIAGNTFSNLIRDMQNLLSHSLTQYEIPPTLIRCTTNILLLQNIGIVGLDDFEEALQSFTKNPLTLDSMESREKLNLSKHDLNIDPKLNFLRDIAALRPVNKDKGLEMGLIQQNNFEMLEEMEAKLLAESFYPSESTKSIFPAMFSIPEEIKEAMNEKYQKKTELKNQLLEIQSLIEQQKQELGMNFEKKDSLDEFVTVVRGAGSGSRTKLFALMKKSAALKTLLNIGGSLDINSKSDKITLNQDSILIKQTKLPKIKSKKVKSVRESNLLINDEMNIKKKNSLNVFTESSTNISEIIDKLKFRSSHSNLSDKNFHPFIQLKSFDYDTNTKQETAIDTLRSKLKEEIYKVYPSLVNKIDLDHYDDRSKGLETLSSNEIEQTKFLDNFMARKLQFCRLLVNQKTLIGSLLDQGLRSLHFNLGPGFLINEIMKSDKKLAKYVQNELEDGTELHSPKETHRSRSTKFSSKFLNREHLSHCRMQSRPNKIPIHEWSKISVSGTRNNLTPGLFNIFHKKNHCDYQLLASKHLHRHGISISNHLERYEMLEIINKSIQENAYIRIQNSLLKCLIRVLETK